jgi:hypothetical protein
MTGNVVVTQGGNVMRGERMVANLTTGVTRVEAPKGRQIEMMMQPGAKDAAPPGRLRAGRESSADREGRESDAGATQDRSGRAGAHQLKSTAIARRATLP